MISYFNIKHNIILNYLAILIYYMIFSIIIKLKILKIKLTILTIFII